VGIYNQKSFVLCYFNCVEKSSIFSGYQIGQNLIERPSWSWSHGSWIYNYIYIQCLSPLPLWVRIPLMTGCTRYNIMWYNLSVTCDRSLVFSWSSGFLHQ